MRMYFPVEWDFGRNPNDGLGGARVEDAGTIYVYDDDDDSETFEQVVLKATLKEVVEYLIDGHASLSSGKVCDPDSIAIMRRLQSAFRDEIERIENSIGDLDDDIEVNGS